MDKNLQLFDSFDKIIIIFEQVLGQKLLAWLPSAAEYLTGLATPPSVHLQKPWYGHIIYFFDLDAITFNLKINTQNKFKIFYPKKPGCIF